MLISVFLFFSALNLNASEKQRKTNDIKKIIVLDPGHGGNDFGALSSDGLAEKNVTLEIAEAIKNGLVNDYEVFLTRTDDYNIHINDRISLANHHKADLYISIHMGGSFLHKTNGMAIFYFSNPTAKPTSTVLYDMEDQLTDWDEIQSRHNSINKKIAKIIADQIRQAKKIQNITIDGAPLAILKGIDMPAILIEFGYITNPFEESLLKNPETLSDYAEIIRTSVDTFFQHTR